MNLDEILTKEFDLGGMDAANRQAILERLNRALFLNLGTRLASELNDHELENFKLLVEGEKPDTVIDVLSNRFPNFQAMLQEEIAQLKAEYDSLMA